MTITINEATPLINTFIISDHMMTITALILQAAYFKRDEVMRFTIFAFKLHRQFTLQ